MKIKTKRALLKHSPALKSKEESLRENCAAGFSQKTSQLCSNLSLLVLLLFCGIAYPLYGQSEYKIGFYTPSLPVSIPRPPKPLAWTSHNKVSHALHISYERMRQYSYGSLSWGGSIGGFQLLKESQYALSTYLSFRLHPIHIGRFFVPFVEYSAGGPTFVSQKVFGNENLGSHFLFQNFLGVGVIIHSNFTLGLTLPHYSSGDLFKPNPGFDVPLLFYFGYRVF